MDSDIQYLKQFIDVSFYDEVTANYNLLDWFIAFDLRYRAYKHIFERQEIIDNGYNEYKEFFKEELEDDIKQEWDELPTNKKKSFYEYFMSCIPSKVDYLISISHIDEREHKRFFKCSNAIINKTIFETNKQHEYSLYENGTINIPIALVDLKSIFLNMKSQLFYYGITDEQKEIVANYLLSSVKDNRNVKIEESDYLKNRKKMNDLPDSVGWFSKGNNVFTEINLNTPDDLLIENFKNWLPTARKTAEELYNKHHKAICDKHYKNGFYSPSNENDLNIQDREIPKIIRNKIKNVDIKKWREHRVLAYIDLVILASRFNIKLTQTNIADIIYSDIYVNREEKLRKTLKPALIKLYGDQTASYFSIKRHGYYREILTKYIAEYREP